MTLVRDKIGHILKKARLAKGLTQEDVAFEAKIDYSYYNQLENGKRNPSVEALGKICKVLGISLKTLF